MKTPEARHFVTMHGNLHWLVPSRSTGSTLRLLAFHTTHEKFRWMEAPERQRGGRASLTAAARLGALSGGKLCVFDLEASTRTMDVWVLDDYGAVPQGSWRLKDRISLVVWNKYDLSRTFKKLEVVESIHDGEEIFLHQEDGRIYVYNLVDKEWRTANVSRSGYSTFVSLVKHKESVLSGQMSFGKALSPALSPMFQRSGPAKLVSLAVY
jgi:F-box interacting protein